MFSKLWKAIKKVFSKILNAIKAFIKKFWVVLLVVAALWFAPAIGGWFASIGAPSWLTSAFSWVGANVTPTVTSIGSWLASGGKALGSSIADGWAALSLGQKAAVGVGGMALLAPEETADFLQEAAKDLGDLAGDVVGGVTAGFVSSPVGTLIMVGLGVWALFLLLEDKDEAQ